MNYNSNYLWSTSMTADLSDYWWERGDWTVLITLRSVIWCVWRWDGGRAECVLWLVMITNYNTRTHGHTDLPTVRYFTYDAFLQPSASPSSARHPVLVWDKIKYLFKEMLCGAILIWAPAVTASGGLTRQDTGFAKMPSVNHVYWGSKTVVINNKYPLNK